MPAAPAAEGDAEHGRGRPRAHAPRRQTRKSTFQTFGQELCVTDRSVCPSPNTVLKEHFCCECQTKFGGRLPVPRAEATLPYWVPLSLRPRKQIPKRVRFSLPQATKTCNCGCHRFGGRLPMPRDQAAMPYWVPRALRPPRKVAMRQNYRAMQEPRVDLRSWHSRWQICDRQLLLQWRLRVLRRDKLLALGTLLPLSLGLLTLLQAALRALVAIRQFFWI